MKTSHSRIRQYALYLFAGVMISAFCACDDQTENGWEEPEKTSLYTGAEEAYAAVDALYKKGAPTFYGVSSPKEGPLAAWGGYMAGLFDNEAKEEAKLCAYSQQLTIDATNISDWVDRFWNQGYEAIRMAHTAIENIPYTQQLTPAQQGQLGAESHFFRAFNYFHLVKAFGELPLLQSGGLEAGRRESLTAVYQQIVGDLQTAIASLPDTAFTENRFRISRTTAQTLLADVYLTMSGYPLRQNRYKEAAELARSVIHSRKHQLTPHGTTAESSAYNVLRTADQNPEYIYSYQLEACPVHSSPVALSLPQAAGSWGSLQAAATNSAYRPLRAYLNLYDSVYDLRMQEQQFFHTFFKYERKGRTVIQTYPQLSYFWYDSEAIRQSGLSNKDMLIYRYAEVLLIAAEAIAQTEGVTAEAVTYLTQVRARAYTKQSVGEISNQLQGLGREKFVQEVWLERMREFPFEMKVWSDIQRTRKYPLTSVTRRGEATFVDVIGAKNPWGAAFEEKHLLLPLSPNLLNKGLEQNKGY